METSVQILISLEELKSEPKHLDTRKSSDRIKFCTKNKYMVWKYTLFRKIVEKEATDDILSAFSIWKYDNDDILNDDLLTNRTAYLVIMMIRLRVKLLNEDLKIKTKKVMVT